MGGQFDVGAVQPALLETDVHGSVPLSQLVHERQHMTGEPSRRDGHQGVQAQADMRAVTGRDRGGHADMLSALWGADEPCGADSSPMSLSR